MKSTVAEFIKGCLACVRFKPIQKPLTIKGVLSKPEPFELISIDCVGPRKWMGATKYYICIIDHYSRYIVLKSSEVAISSKKIIETLNNYWLPYFHCPMAILTDRGGEFISKQFIDFVVDKIGAAIIRTSPYYPQGNSINEASHRTINRSLTLLESDFEMNFEECLQFAAALHNTSPHAATENTPFFLLFGFEATLPGWQGLQKQNKDLKSRNLNRTTEKIKSVYRKLLMEEREDFNIVKGKYIEGDWVVYKLSPYEQTNESGLSKFAANWSLPSKIIKIDDKKVVLKTWEGDERQCPVSQIYKLKGNINPLLIEMNYNQLKGVFPKQNRLAGNQPPPEEWKKVLDDLKENNKVEEIGKPKRKRQRKSSHSGNK